MGVQGSNFSVSCLVFRVWGSGFRVRSLGSRDWSGTGEREGFYDFGGLGFILKCWALLGYNEPYAPIIIGFERLHVRVC